jgi:two-component system cell cycle sensor histidine kinase/response regulator CckA
MTQDIARIAEAAEHGAALARQLVMFSRTDGGDPEELDLSEVTDATVRLVRSTAPDGAVIVARTSDEPLPVRVDPTKLRQVLMNLVDNAFDAVRDGGGEIVLATDEVLLIEDTAGPGIAPPAGAYARLLVADTGAGMPPDVMARALEPAYTTKRSGEGTGLGLAIVHGVVKGAGGHIALRSEPGGGTTIEILLPLAMATPERPAGLLRPEPRPVPDASHARILLVEDDAAVLELTARVLLENGFDVVTASDGHGALALVDEHAIDLLLTDQTLPGSSGLEVARRLAELQPGTPAIVMSGYAAEVAALRPTNVDWLHKPFGADALLGAVRGALGRP